MFLCVRETRAKTLGSLINLEKDVNKHKQRRSEEAGAKRGGQKQKKKKQS